MSKKPELREELAAERRELKAAVATLRSELDQTSTRLKRLAAKVGAAASAAVLAKIILAIKRSR